MSDLPTRVRINEEGPREGFQIEAGPISTARKLELIDALSETGLRAIQIVSFVNPQTVPGMADAEQIVARFRRKPGVTYTGLWLNDRGFERARATGRLDISGLLSLTASAAFLQRNQRRTMRDDLTAQREIAARYRALGIPMSTGFIMAAFGCNFQGEIAPATVAALAGDLLTAAAESGYSLSQITLGDTMAWATPATIQRVVGAVRARFPDLEIALHLHDTRGMGIANALAGLQMGVSIFDASVGGLGGCPFAAHASAAGNVCTEDLVFMCEEMGIETGIDLERLIEAGRLAEDIVGHPLPGSVKQGGSLRAARRRLQSQNA